MEITLTSDQRELLKKYKDEAFGYIADAETAKNQLKEVVYTAATSTGLSKKLIGKFYKTAYSDKVRELLDEAEAIQFLTEG